MLRGYFNVESLSKGGAESLQRVLQFLINSSVLSHSKKPCSYQRLPYWNFWDGPSLKLYAWHIT